MRTLREIKKRITDEFMASEILRSAYRLSENDTFENKFSTVSIENIIFSIVASAIYVLEGLFNVFRKEMDKMVASSIVASIPWYHRKALEFQYGEDIEYNEDTMTYEYLVDVPESKIVKYAAVREESGYVYILISGDDAGVPIKLSNDVLTAFREYMRQIKPAGIPIEVASYNPDNIIINIGVEYNPLVLNPDGSKISEPSVFPVEDALNEYLRNIEYGGVYNSTKMVDAIQQVPGVNDVIVRFISVIAANSLSVTILKGNTWVSESGAFRLINPKGNISYVTRL